MDKEMIEDLSELCIFFKEYISKSKNTVRINKIYKLVKKLNDII